MSAKRILIVNGPNLNLLGKREPDTYGTESFENYFVKLKDKFTGLELEYFQSNIEGELINQIQKDEFDGFVLNAGGYTHTSVALRDAIAAQNAEVVEVHISNVSNRETFRHESLISPVCVGCVFGFGLKSYDLALNFFIS